MRVGIDVRAADPPGPGQQRYLWRLGHWLAEQGHDCHFLTCRPQRPDRVLQPGVTLHRLPASRPGVVRSRVRALELDVLLVNPERAGPYRGLRADVLRTGYGTDQYSEKLRSFSGPVARAARSLERQTPWVRARRRWERRFYEAHDPGPDVIAQSGYIRDRILDRYDVAPERVHVVHNGVDTSEFSRDRRLAMRADARARWSIPPGDTCLLFLGHNYRLKGLWTLLPALSSIDPAVRPRLLVVGRGTGAGQRRKARRLVKAHGLTEHVVLGGPVRHSIAALAAADALVHPTWHDAFGFVVLEAVACGLPVVTTPWAGAAELLRDGASARLVEPDDPAALGGALRELCDSEFRTRIGNEATGVGAACTEERNFTRVLRIFEEVHARKNGPARTTRGP